MKSMTMELNDSEIRTAIALYLKAKHPDHQIAQIEMAIEDGSFGMYIEPGQAIARGELLPTLKEETANV